MTERAPRYSRVYDETERTGEDYTDVPGGKYVVSGWVGVGFMFILFCVWCYCLLGVIFMNNSKHSDKSWPVFAAYVIGLSLLTAYFSYGRKGFFKLNPNMGALITQMGGKYLGSISTPGFYFTLHPLYVRRMADMKVRNFETSVLKVNDCTGNPIEISAVVVHKIVDVAAAGYNVVNVNKFVKNQAEAAIREVASRHPYIANAGDDSIGLQDSGEEVTNELRDVLQARVHRAGVQISETQLTHLAYADEIAGSMLLRQQASSVVAARSEIVKGAVGMVDETMTELADRGLGHMTVEERENAVGNLLVVLCADSQGATTSVRAGKA